MNYEAINPFAIAGVIGILLAVFWIAANILGWIWSGCWAWIDDSEAPEVGPINRLSMKLIGFEYKTDRLWKYYTDGEDDASDGVIGFFLPLLAMLISPLVFTLAFFLYPLTLSIFGLYLTARLARFARRHKKLFDKHIKDPEAHK
jgi:hypothetical protein